MSQIVEAEILSVHSGKYSTEFRQITHTLEMQKYYFMV